MHQEENFSLSVSGWFLMTFSFKFYLFIYLLGRGLFEMKIYLGSCWCARLLWPGPMFTGAQAVQPGRLRLLWAVVDPSQASAGPSFWSRFTSGPGPPLAPTVAVPVMVQLSQAHSRDLWAASTYNLNMQSSYQSQPWWESGYLSLGYICMAPTWRLQPTLSWQGPPGHLANYSPSALGFWFQR